MLLRVLGGALVVVAFFTGCDGSSEDGATVTTGVGETPAASFAARGGSPPEYTTPVRLMPGDYVPPSASKEARAKWLAALDSSKSLPQFSGTVNNFRVFSYQAESQDPSQGQKECVAVEFAEVDLFKPTYLPAGTFARSPQYSGICADGSTAWVNQDFGYGYGIFSIGYELGERAVGTDATEDRVKAGTIAGQPALLIEPLIKEGNGQSIVAFPLGKGFIVIGAEYLPINETVKIAEGVSCAACSAGHQVLPPEGRSAVDVALNASRAEGVLSGDAKETDASRMTLSEAQAVLTGWGAIFAEYADYPSLESTVWLVRILGKGVPPCAIANQWGIRCVYNWTGN